MHNEKTKPLETAIVAGDLQGGILTKGVLETPPPANGDSGAKRGLHSKGEGGTQWRFG